MSLNLRFAVSFIDLYIYIYIYIYIIYIYIIYIYYYNCPLLISLYNIVVLVKICRFFNQRC